MSTILLDVRQVHAKYGRQDILRGVSLRISTGEWFCLLGPNGVGKSTLVRCISGAVTPTAGDLQIAGHSVALHVDGDSVAFQGLPHGLVIEVR